MLLTPRLPKSANNLKAVLFFLSFYLSIRHLNAGEDDAPYPHALFSLFLLDQTHDLVYTAKPTMFKHFIHRNPALGLIPEHLA